MTSQKSISLIGYGLCAAFLTAHLGQPTGPYSGTLQNEDTNGGRADSGQ